MGRWFGAARGYSKLDYFLIESFNRVGVLGYSMGKKRLVSWKPVGAVECPRCSKNKNSGGYQYIEDMEEMSREKKLMCDSCRRKFVKWYKQREDRSGIVET